MLVHTLLSLDSLDNVLSHPCIWLSWEGFVIENILVIVLPDVTPWFYRTLAGAEIDLILEQGIQKRIAIEIKRSLAPKLSKGFYSGYEDIKVIKRFYCLS